MRYFKRNILKSLANGCRDLLIPINGEYTFNFNVQKQNFPIKYAFRFQAEPDYFWKYRNERNGTYTIGMSIEDALTQTETANNEKYALKIMANGERYPRNAYVKLFNNDLVAGKEYTFELYAKAENLQYLKNGVSGVELEIYRKKENRHINDTYDKADIIKQLKLPVGSYDWKKLSMDFKMPEDVAVILVKIGVNDAIGLSYFSSPRLFEHGCDNIIPPLAPPQERCPQFNYIAENLSRRDWIEFELFVDGKSVFDGEKYTSIFRRPDFEIDLGFLSIGKHDIKIKLKNDYDSAVALVIQQLEILEYGANEFEIISCPEFVNDQEYSYCLIETQKENLKISIDNVEYFYADKGYHALKIPKFIGDKNKVIVCSENFSDSFEVEKVPYSKDKIYLSTGDSIFIGHNNEDMFKFLEWYLQNNIGNAICFRHSYRWGGARQVNIEMWQKIIPLLNELNIAYSLMIDGRELPGKNSNPSDDLMAEKLYLGRQAHENDGTFYYWDNKIWGRKILPEPYADLLARSVDVGGIQPHVRPKRNGDNAWWFFDPTNAKNMKEAAEDFVKNLAESKGLSTRHSGPSPLFRYFFQAGYEFLLAEQMYGPEEVILSSLRGASKAYNAKGFGAHLATQWSSRPHDTVEHALRYFLSLATCYMQGVTQINTEEGLYRMESGYVDYDKYSSNCLRHLKYHTNFRRFMQKNPRQGELQVSIGVIQGRYDSWNNFSRQKAWQREGGQWLCNSAEASFDLLKVFYPRSEMKHISCCPCPNEPQGWYSGTPYGVVDLIPFEGDFSKYKALIFLGWHSYELGDGEKLANFVKNGGKLLLSSRHLSTSLLHNGKRELIADSFLDKLLGDNWQQETGTIKRIYGKGKVTYFAGDYYPADDEICNEYQQAMHSIGNKFSQNIEANEDVNYAIYKKEDSTTNTYFLNIRWWDKKSSTVKINNKSLKIPFGEIIKVEWL